MQENSIVQNFVLLRDSAVQGFVLQGNSAACNFVLAVVQVNRAGA